MAGHPGEAYGLISDAYYELKKNGVGFVFMTNGKDGAYAFGTVSAFYTVEEAVFAAVNEFLTSVPLSVRSESHILSPSMELQQNFPNPFNPSTTIEYSVPSAGSAHHVVLKVYDVLGNDVATLVNERRSSGKYSVTFDAASLSSGVYFSQLHIGSLVATRRMLFLK